MRNSRFLGVVVFHSYKIEFVWRQLEFAFFGALTSVGALFVFYRKSKPPVEPVACTAPRRG